MVENEHVFAAIATGLARMMPPDLSQFSADEVTVAMSSLVGFNGPDSASLKLLGEMISTASKGYAKVEQIGSEAYPGPLNKGPTLYLKLTNPYLTRYVALGDYEPPVTVIS